MKALIIVDMLNDFVDGKLANPRAQAITEPLQRLLAPDLHLRVAGVVGVVREDDDPAVLARMGEEALQWRRDRLRLRVGELPVDEVLQHVDDDESLHACILQEFVTISR